MLNQHDVQRIAQLAKLRLDGQQAQAMQQQLNRFLQMVERMQAAETDGVEPLTHPLDMVQDFALRLADDVVSESNRREQNQQCAPAVENGLFLVPRVVE